tara:strand:- start:818 stop:1039 length:222 start_codon:yes stop_codon:yes gene_type:complete
MKINILEIPSPTADNQYYYSLEKSLYGGYVVYIELKSDLEASGTLDDSLTKHHWKPIPPNNYDPNQLELKFYD